MFSAILLSVSTVGLSLVFLPPASAAGGLAIDKLVSKHQSSPSKSVVSPAFTTGQSGELLVAFVTADGPGASGSQQFSSVTGGGLTWRLRQRTNVQYGTAEIWQAVASGILTNAAVTATHTGSYQASVTVATFTGAATTVDGAVAGASRASGAPAATLTTTRTGSWVWGVGNDWSSAIARTVGPGQTMVDEFLSSKGDAFWTQRQTAPGTALAPSPVTLNDTAPTADMWNMSLIEILPAFSPDTEPPTAPTGLAAAATSPTNVDLSWIASTDNVGVTGYRVSRDGVQVGTPVATNFSDNTVVGSTQYIYTVRAVDAAGNVSADSAPAAVTTPVPDTVAPVISAVSAGTPTQTGATVTWTTDETSTTQVEYGATVAYGSSTTKDPSLTTSHSQTLTGLTAGTVYHYRVKSADASNNLSASPDATFTTAAPTPDTTPPTVSLSSPVNGATVTGTVPVNADASDNQGVAGVQFKLDGANFQSEDTVSPYSVQWDTTTAAASTHTLTAVARDAAGNTSTAAPVSVTVSNSGSDPAVVGSWGPVQAWPEVSIHAALTNTGKVLTFQGDFTQGGQQYLLDPVTGSYIQVPNAAADLFCAGQAVLPDGRILVIGGTATSGGLGIRDVTAFNPGTEAWQLLAPMHYPRWYPTGTTLGDGRVLVTSGANTSSTDIVKIPELYDTQHNTWSDLTSATNGIPYYPFIYQLPDGRVLQAGASEQASSTLALNVATQQWTTIDGRVTDASSITNYAPGKFMKAGSASDGGFSGASSSSAFTLDMNLTNPVWQSTSSMQYPRSFVNLTNLPDGTVLATGGGTDKSGQDETKAVKPAEIWNPTSGTWTTVAALTAPRLYHSTALLLPDGRVFVSGGGSDLGVADQKNYQIYSPAYLFKGARPTITSAAGTVQYNASAFVQTPNAVDIRSVSLIRTGSVTHSFDQNTRGLSLPFSQASGGLNVQMPLNGNYAPPGYYMLSIVDGNSVPSVASMVRLPAPYEDAVAPTAPSNLSAVGSVGQADLSWTGSTDNVGVAKYDIYRSTTPSFAPSPANQAGQVSGSTTVFRDSPLAAGTYYYQVKAEDAASNLSPSSNEASATALADSTAPTAPSNLTATAGAGQISLSWNASTDNVGVVRYNVSRNGAAIGTATGTSFTDGSVVAGTTYTYTVTAQDSAGNVSGPSNIATATALSGVRTITVDKLVTTHQGTNATTVSVAGLTTTGSNELLLAFVSSDGPSGAGTASIGSVSGAGLTWTLRQRTNAQAGTAEIWQAISPVPLNNVTVTATQGSGTWQSAMTVVAFNNADTANGAVAGASAASGAPSASLATTRAGSWVWSVGTDWTASLARTVGPNQTLVDQYFPPAGDTYWVQRQTAPTATAGTVVPINDTAPTADKWDLALIEILAAP